MLDRSEHVNGCHEWRSVRRGSPCPICGKPDWCSITTDGELCSCRRQGEPCQERRDRTGQPYWLYRRDRGSYVPVGPRPTPGGDAGPARRSQPPVRLRHLTPEERQAAICGAWTDLDQMVERLPWETYLSPRRIAELLCVDYDLPPQIARRVLIIWDSRNPNNIIPEVGIEEISEEMERASCYAPPLRRGIRLQAYVALRGLDDIPERVIPPLTPEQLAQQAARELALPVRQEVSKACTRLRTADLPRRSGCGCQHHSAICLRNRRNPKKFIWGAPYCKSLRCPACEAYWRANIIEIATQAILFQIPVTRVLAPRDQTSPPGLPWRSEEVSVLECREEERDKVAARIRRAGETAGIVDPGYQAVRGPNGSLLFITEAPVANGRRLSPDTAARLALERIGTALHHKRRKNDVCFGGRWRPLEKGTKYDYVPCTVTTAEAVELAEKTGYVAKLKPLLSEQFAGGVLCLFSQDMPTKMEGRFLCQLATDGYCPDDDDGVGNPTIVVVVGRIPDADLAGSHAGSSGGVEIDLTDL